MPDLLDDMFPPVEPAPEETRKYIVFTSLEAANAFVSSTDSLLGYPEQEPDFTQIGGGTHASWELGRAMHYCTPQANADGDAWMVLFTDCIDIPEGAEAVEALPEGWYLEEE